MTTAHQNSYAQFRRRLILGFSCLVILLVCSLSWKIVSSYRSDRITARSQTKNFVQAMNAHVLSAIQLIDLSLISSADAIKALDPNTPPTLESIKPLLRASARMPDANAWLVFIDASGHGVVSSNGLPIAGLPYADRPYFYAHLGEVDRGLFVGMPKIGSVSTRRVFFLSRRVVSVSGKFLGVVVAPIDASVFATVFANALFQPGLSITLAHTDGKIIARAPKFEESFATDIGHSVLFRYLEKAPSGTYEATSLVDGDTRVYSYKTLDGLPLVVSVGMASQSWTEGLIDDFTVAGIGLVGILLVMFFSGHYALSSFRKLETSEAIQRGLNRDLRVAQLNLASSEKRTRMITDNLPALVAYVDADQRYVFHNSFYRHIKNIDVDTMLGKTMREVYCAQDYALVEVEVALAMSGQRVAFERAVTIDGAERYFNFAYTPDLDADGKVVGLYSMVTDITSMKRIQNQLTLLARIDTLTGLPNRNYLYDRLVEGISRSRRNGTRLACLYLDLDHFKQVNDALGHAGGDALLKQFGARLQGCVRQTDMVARLAGDEFIIVIEGLEQPEGAQQVAAKIIHAMQTPFILEGSGRLITTSIGVVITDGSGGDDPDALLKHADAALYRAKRLGKNLYQVYEPGFKAA